MSSRRPWRPDWRRKSPAARLGLLLVPAILVILGLVVLYGIATGTVHARAAPPAPMALQKPIKPAPAVTFTDAKGGRHGLADFKGHYVLLNLWATWCGPCVAELPALARLSTTVPALKVLAVDVGGAHDTPALADSFLKAHHAASLGTYLDSQVMMIRSFGAYGLPTTVLIDPKGNVIARAEGAAQWTSPKSIAYFRKLTES